MAVIHSFILQTAHEESAVLITAARGPRSHTEEMNDLSGEEFALTEEFLQFPL